MAGKSDGATLTWLAGLSGREVLAFALGVLAALAVIQWFRFRRLATDAARRENALQELADHQAAALRDAREDLENELRRSQRLASLGLLVGGVAHDFNNLLTVVLGNAQVIELQAQGGHLAAAQRIRAAAEQGQRMTRQLFAVASEQVVSVDPCDLGELVSGFLPTLQQVVGPRVRIEFLATGGPAMVRALPSQIEQILLNLFTNARDAMPSGGRIEIGLGTHEARVSLSVRDDGPGMTADVKARVFEPYFTTKADSPERGIGLATVKGIVVQLGGRVRVESAPGAGAEFAIELPRADAEPTVVLPATAPRSAAVARPPTDQPAI